MREVFNHMIYELESNRLEVFLMPAPAPAFPGHQIRAVESQNPEWYRYLCRQYQSNRNSRKGKHKKHGDTKIKRRHILYILQHLADGKTVDSKYKKFLISIAKKMEEEFEEEFLSTNYTN